MSCEPCQFEGLGNFQRACRACLQCTADINIFRSKSILEMLQVCAPIEIHEDDGLPDGLCIECINQLRNAFEFKDKCVRSDNHLRKLLMQNEIKEEFKLKCEQTEPDTGDNIDLLSQTVSGHDSFESLNPDSFQIPKVENEEEFNDLSEFLIVVIEPERKDDLENNDESSTNNIIKTHDERPTGNDLSVDNENIQSQDNLATHYENDINNVQGEVIIEEIIENEDLEQEEGVDILEELCCIDCTKIFSTEEEFSSHVCVADDAQDISESVIIVGEPLALFGLDNKENNNAVEISMLHNKTDNNIQSINQEVGMEVDINNENKINNSNTEIKVKLHVGNANNKARDKKVACDYCNVSVRREDLINHYKKFHSKAVYKCILCKQSVRGAAKAEFHKLAHKEHICDVCGKKFFYRRAIVSHLSRSACAHGNKKIINHEEDIDHFEKIKNIKKDGDNKYPCIYCDQKCTTKQYIIDHIKRKHITSYKSHQCPLCDLRFISFKEKERHERTHSMGGKFPCPLCGEPFETLQNVQDHLKDHDKLENNVVQKSIKDTGGTASDVEQKTQEFKNSYNIFVLDKSGKLPNKLPSVKKSKRIKEELVAKGELDPVLCTYCNEYFLTPQYLYKHWATSHGNIWLKCNECSKIVMGANKIERHKKFHVKYPCEICGREFSKTNMIAHRYTHLGPVVCEICKNPYSTLKSLRAHMLYSHKDFLPQCDHCGRKFNTKLSLLDHIRREHSQDSVAYHSCQYCGKKFEWSRLRKQHERSHESKMLPCALCELTFPDLDMLNDHVATEHTNWSFKDAKQAYESRMSKGI